MARDPLEQFKRRPAGSLPQSTPQPPPVSSPPASPSAPPASDEEISPFPREYDQQSGKEVYKAFEVSSRRRERLQIRQTTRPWLHPHYIAIKDIIPDGHYGTQITLVCPDYLVYIQGRNLQQVLYALIESRCRYIQDYHREAFAPFTDQKAPFIESIRVAEKKSPAQEKEPPAKKSVSANAKQEEMA